MPSEPGGLQSGRPQYRRIVHIDMDAFYASVEVREQPSLRGLPLAVAHASRRGVVLTASYEARAFGVRSAMPTALALERCPDLLLVPPRMELYREVSLSLRAIYARYTELVEPLSLDEAYLDVTRPLGGPPSGTLVARALKAEILRETGLTSSAGVSHTKFLAKLASDMNKPDGLTVIRPEDAPALIARLPVSAFFGVGPATERRLKALGVHSGADLAARPLEELTRHFGAAGAHYHRISHGLDERPVDPHRDRRSVGAERTFDEDLPLSGLEGALLRVCAALMPRLHAARFRGGPYLGRTLVLKLKFADPARTVITRRVQAEAPLLREEQLLPLARALLQEVARGRTYPVRLLGLAVHAPPQADQPAAHPSARSAAQQVTRLATRLATQPPLFADLAGERDGGTLLPGT